MANSNDVFLRLCDCKRYPEVQFSYFISNVSFFYDYKGVNSFLIKTCPFLLSVEAPWKKISSYHAK